MHVLEVQQTYEFVLFGQVSGDDKPSAGQENRNSMLPLKLDRPVTVPIPACRESTFVPRYLKKIQLFSRLDGGIPPHLSTKSGYRPEVFQDLAKGLGPKQGTNAACPLPGYRLGRLLEAINTA